MSDDPRPPYVRFEVRETEDRNASIEAGHYIGKDVYFAIITPPGSKDEIEKEAETWLRDSEKAARDSRIPATWPPHYRRLYEMFREGLEIPEEGTPILGWPMISPAQQKTIIACNIRTVEDLAEANEVALSAIGMGAQALRLKARAWLEAADKTGKPAQKISALETELASLKKSIEDKDARISELEMKLEVLSKEDA